MISTEREEFVKLVLKDLDRNKGFSDLSEM